MGMYASMLLQCTLEDFLEQLSEFAGVQGRGIDQPNAALETEGLLGPGCGEGVTLVANGALSVSPHTCTYKLESALFWKLDILGHLFFEKYGLGF